MMGGAKASSTGSKSTTMSGGGGRKAAIPGGEEAEVEALIRAAQDAVLLKLQANSHLVSSTTPAASASSTPPSLDAAAIPGGEEAEVEALIRAAQDAVLLKLQANSHLVSSTTPVASASSTPPPSLDAAALDPLDSDLARRFDALKSRAAAPEPKPEPVGGRMDELEARFAALKGAAAGPEKDARVRLEDLGGESSEDEADEVDKVMRWAMDAARLDVAAAGAGCGKAKKRADDDEEVVDEEKDEKSSEEEDERVRLDMARKKEMARTKSKNNWFFL